MGKTPSPFVLCFAAAGALSACSGNGPSSAEAGTGGMLTGAGASAGVGGGSGNVTTTGGGAAGTVGSTTGSYGGAGGVAGSAGTTVGDANSVSTESAVAGGAGGSVGTVGGVDTTDGATGIGGTAGTGGATGTGGTAGAGDVSGAGGATGGTTTGAAGAGGAGGGTSNTCPTATPLSGGQQYCMNSKGSAGGGYAYELWASGSGSGCMTVYGVDANFGASWDGVDDFLARVGLDFDQTKTHSQLGTISADFAETKTGEEGFLYIGIYGWTVNPLREYYILDDWGSTKPGDTASDGSPRTHAGTITVDGDSYEVWTHTQQNKPAITGDNMNFDQYFSVRQTARQCGHISISDHFSQWEGLGLTLGNLYEAKLLVEAQDNSGSVEFTTATVVVQ